MVNARKRHRNKTCRPGRMAKVERQKNATFLAEFKKTPEEQIAALDERLGKDIGAVKERARLRKLI